MMGFKSETLCLTKNKCDRTLPAMHSCSPPITRASQRLPLLADSRRLRSYSHLLLNPKFTRLPPTGDGVAGAILDMVDSPNRELRPNEVEDPKLGRRPLSLPPFDTALWNNGLVEGEKDAPDDSRRPEAPVLLDKGDAALLAELAVRDAERRYFGGVMYVLPGVSGEEVEGSSPRRERWVGVRGISERSSFDRKRGDRAMTMFDKNSI